MKKLLLIVLLIAITAPQVDAAKRRSHRSSKRSRSKSDTELRFGGRGGLTLSTMLMSPDQSSTGAVASFHLGAVAEYPLSERFGIEGGLLFNVKGTSNQFDEYMSSGGYSIHVSGSEKIKPSYLEIPIDVKLNLDFGGYQWLLFAGPYLGVGIGGKIVADYSYSSDMPGFDPSIMGLSNVNQSIKYGSGENDNMKRFDYGLSFGGGWEIEGFQIRGQYSLGLANLSTASGQKMTNYSYLLSIAYMVGGN